LNLNIKNRQMKIIKENWKMVVFIILVTLLIIKLDKLASTFNDLSLNGRFTKVSDEQEIMDTRTGKVYIAKLQRGKLAYWKQVSEAVK
jgi:hypothetical protein